MNGSTNTKPNLESQIENNSDLVVPITPILNNYKGIFTFVCLILFLNKIKDLFF